MKKDYIPVKLAEETLSEVGFIEAYWNQVWHKSQEAKNAGAKIASSEEYRWMDPYLAALPSGSRILDGGCGLGDWTIFYRQRGFDVVGMDICQDVVQGLNKIHPGDHFVAGDIRRTDFPDAYFEAYFSWGTFEHFELGMGAPLKEAWRILKPGGHLFISVPYQNRRHLHRDQVALWHWDETSMRFYQWRLTKPELQRELELSGFRVEGIRTIHKREGLLRAIQHDLGVPRGSWLAKGLNFVLAPFVPRDWVAHMLLAIGSKQE